MAEEKIKIGPRDGEVQQWMDTLFPVGGERWVKIKVIDQDKAAGVLWMASSEDRAKPKIDKYGFFTTALSFREEYTPQIAALFDLKTELIGELYGLVPDYILQNMKAKFDAKMEELKKYTIKTEIPVAYESSNPSDSEPT